MARTKSYERQVLNMISGINKKILDVERTFGVGSEQYNRYVNSITAALPKESYHYQKSGGIRINKSKANIQTLKKGQLSSTSKLPTAKQSLNKGKRAQAKTQLRQKGIEPTAKAIGHEALTISDQEALEELAAKSYIEAIENEESRLNYDESVKEEMKQKGAKTYQQLKEIMERGEKKRENRARNREAGRRYREKHREQINQRARERRAAAKARVAEV